MNKCSNIFSEFCLKNDSENLVTNKASPKTFKYTTIHKERNLLLFKETNYTIKNNETYQNTEYYSGKYDKFSHKILFEKGTSNKFLDTNKEILNKMLEEDNLLFLKNTHKYYNYHFNVNNAKVFFQNKNGKCNQVVLSDYHNIHCLFKFSYSLTFKFYEDYDVIQVHININELIIKNYEKTPGFGIELE